MEPVSLIIAALGTGAIAASKETAGTAVKDAYQGLKALIKQKFVDRGKEEDSDIVDKYEKKLDSEAFKALLKEELVNLGVDRDEIIVKAAQELLKQEKPEETARGKYNTHIEGDFKGIQGDVNGGNITQTIS
jgi:disulfide oxidoreductase YuzD